MAQFGDLTGALLDLELNSDDSTILYTSTRRAAAVNAGMAEFASLTECYARRSTIAVSCNTAEYGLSTISDYARLSEKGLPEWHLISSGGTATILAGDDFPRRDELWLNRQSPSWRASTTVGTPTAYYLRPDGGRLYIGLDVRPDVGSSETAKLVVPYVARPVPMTASTSVPFTDATGATRDDLTEYHQACVHYAAYKLLPLMGDREGAQGQLALFMDYVKRFAQNMRPKGGTHVTLGRDYLREARRRGVDDDRVPVTQWS